MKGRALLTAAVAGLVLSFHAPLSAAPPASGVAWFDADAIEAAARDAYEEGDYAFCTRPRRPLGPHQRALCPLSPEIDGCDGFHSACALTTTPDPGWLARLFAWIQLLLGIGIYVVVAAIALALAIPLVAALRRRRRGRKAPLVAPNEAMVIETERPAAAETSDAEALLGLAHEHRARGDLRRALGLYLAASLAALDRRGAVVLARHRTNGEYVRSCADEAARPLLRAIVREAEQTSFGGAPPTEAGVSAAAERARRIVHGVALLCLVSLSGCAATPRSDPAGDELPREVLRRSGFEVGAPTSSLATMPLPTESERAAVLVIDVERVPLDLDAQRHVVRWVEAGGALVVLGTPELWPPAFAATREEASTRDLVVRITSGKARPSGWGALATGDDPPGGAQGAPELPSLEVSGARLASADAFAWAEAGDAAPLAFLGDRVYASKRRVGSGAVIGVANADLLTNVGVRPPGNAAALVALLGAAAISEGELAREVLIARAEDGIRGPSSPIEALGAAGLGKATVHALFASLLLILAFGVRHARARPAPSSARRAFAEHVEATGAFYARARAHTHALGAYGRFVDLRLREVLPRGADPVEFLAARSGTSADRVAELHARAKGATAEDQPRGDELRVIEELSQILDRATSPADAERSSAR